MRLVRLPLILALLQAAPGIAANGQDSLPSPTGAYAVGRTRLDWGELQVYAWYPAIRRGPPARYFPDFARIESRIGVPAMKDELRESYDRVREGRVVLPVAEGAPPATGRRFPVLIFSHGFGESGLTYASLLTELASHGYVVFSVEHPGDAYAVAYPDGRVVPFPQAAWDSALKAGRAVAFQLAQIPVRAQALETVLERIVREAREAPSSSIFARLDLTRLGALGHSLGGMAAAELCRRDARIRACLNQDAEYRGIPWLAGDSIAGPRQAFAFLATNHSLYAGANSDPPPSDEALAREGLTRAGYDSLVRGRAAAQDSALASIRGGAVRVSLQAPDFSHRSFMDLGLLGASSDSGALVHRRNLDLARRYTLAFFDRALQGLPSSALDESSLPAGVRIERWRAHY